MDKNDTITDLANQNPNSSNLTCTQFADLENQTELDGEKISSEKQSESSRARKTDLVCADSPNKSQLDRDKRMIKKLGEGIVKKYLGPKNGLQKSLTSSIQKPAKFQVEYTPLSVNISELTTESLQQFIQQALNSGLITLQEQFATKDELMRSNNQRMEQFEDKVMNATGITQKMITECLTQTKHFEKQIEYLSTHINPVKDLKLQITRTDRTTISINDQINLIQSKMNMLDVSVPQLQDQQKSNFKHLKERVEDLAMLCNNFISQKLLDEKFQDIFTLLKPMISKAITESELRSADFFTKKEQYSKDLHQKEVQIGEAENKIQNLLACTKQQASQIQLIQTTLKNKLDVDQIKVFQNTIKQLPNITKFEEERKETHRALLKFDHHLKNQQQKVEQQVQIIARYDEVMCEKASKHSISELKAELFKRMDETQMVASAASRLTKESRQLLTQMKQDQAVTHDKITIMEERQREIPRIQTQVDTIQTSFDRLQLKMNFKVNIDNFEHQIYHKAEKDVVEALEQKVDYWQKHFKSTIVVLNESLQLHSQRADETIQCRQNRIAMLLSQMNALVNSVDNNSKQLQRFFSEQGVQMIKDSSGDVALQDQVHSQMPMSPRTKRALLLQSQNQTISPKLLRKHRLKSSNIYMKHLSGAPIHEMISEESIYNNQPESNSLMSPRSDNLITPQDYRQSSKYEVEKNRTPFIVQGSNQGSNQK